MPGYGYCRILYISILTHLFIEYIQCYCTGTKINKKFISVALFYNAEHMLLYILLIITLDVYIITHNKGINCPYKSSYTSHQAVMRIFVNTHKTFKSGQINLIGEICWILCVL